MKKSKLLKTISFSSLALLMGAAGVFAFAPLGASPSVASASEMVETTTEQGLITPKADDPVIYTTESGLEIKWGNAPTINNSMPSTGLAGFPYFSTSKNGTTYDWVIIGRGLNTDVFTETIQSFLFSNWKTNNSAQYSNGAYGSAFFNGTHESSTPAGSAINSVVPSKSYVSDKVKVSKSVVQNKEILSGCVLVWANFLFDSNTTIYYTNAYLDSRDACLDGPLNPFKNRHLEYYNQDVFGFGNNLNSIKLTTVHQTNQWWDGSKWITNVENQTNLHFFPLAGGRYSNENFVITTYLTTAAQRAMPSSVNGWPMLRSTHFGTQGTYQAMDFWYNDGSSIWTSGYKYHILNIGLPERISRPAFILEL